MNNRAGGVDAPITDNNGNRLSGADFLVQLYAGASEQNLAPVGPAIPFRTGIAAGYFVDAYSRIIPAVQPGGIATLQIRAWETSAGTTSTNRPRRQAVFTAFRSCLMRRPVAV